MISDRRQLEDVVWDEKDNPVREGDELRIRGEAFAREMSFLDFCGKEELDLSKFSISDRQVMVCTRDYYCPIRNRVVLHAGCAYGAPVFLHWVRHKRLKHTKKGVLGMFIADLVREETLQDADLEQKHRDLIALLSKEPQFEYFPADESLNLNGKHFTKGIPAKILRHLIESHRKDAKSEFEYRDLKRNFEITLGQKNSNFEVRFYRLVEKLDEEKCGFRIEKTGRGRFRLEVKGGYQYREVGNGRAVIGGGAEG